MSTDEHPCTDKHPCSDKYLGTDKHPCTDSQQIGLSFAFVVRIEHSSITVANRYYTNTA